jgi:excisionase family DNA binding protein
MDTLVRDREFVVAEEEERALLEKLERILGDGTNKVSLSLENGEKAELPDTIHKLLQHTLQYLKQDKVVSVLPINKLLSVQEAAVLIDVSVPYLLEALDNDELPYVEIGTRKMILYKDALVYETIFKQKRHQALLELAQMSQEAGLYD